MVFGSQRMPVPRQSQFQPEEFIEHQPCTGTPGVVQRIGEMNLVERFGQGRQVLGGQDPLRHDIGDFVVGLAAGCAADPLEGFPQQRSHAPRVQAGVVQCPLLGVHRDDPAHVGQVVVQITDDFEFGVSELPAPEPSGFSADGDVITRYEHPVKPPGVSEPDALQLAGSVADLHDGALFPPVDGLDIDHAADDGYLFVGRTDGFDGRCRGAVDVATGDAAEQVADGVNADLPQGVGTNGTHTRQAMHLSGQTAYAATVRDGMRVSLCIAMRGHVRICHRLP